MENRKKKSVVQELWYKIRRSRFRRRLACMVMAAAILLTQINVNPLVALAYGFQLGENVWKQSDKLAVAKAGRDGFDIYGVDGGSFYQTTYSNQGYRITSMVDNRRVIWNGAEGEEINIGSSLKGRFDCDIVYNGRYAKITYTIRNTGSTVKSFKVGSSADIQIDKNDRAPIVGTSMGMRMEDGKGKVFHLVVPDADTTWYGFYNKAEENTFNNLSDKSIPYTRDSGMAWSWNGSVASGGTWKRSALIGIGELPKAPAAPSIKIALNDGKSFVVPNETVTVSGTATAGTTVHILAGGEEYEASVGSNGKFSKQITIPSDAKDEIDIICWAVSKEGGISNAVTKKLTVLDGPLITLTDSSTSVMEGDSLNETWYKGFIKTSRGTISHTDISTNAPGTYNVTYTAKVSGFADVKATMKVTVLAHPLEIASPTAVRSGTTSKYNLTARLNYPGADKITDSGFVWGIMQNPTTSMCNGKNATSSVVKTKGSSISVTTDDIVDGVTYYCRAYVVAGGETYYSTQTSFGLNAKSYGKFTVSGNGRTFTITRADGTDGAQTVYYRTKNGSAVAGTHYTKAAGKVTFAQGETAKTVTVTEKGANEVYGGNNATAYSNASREYFFEIYRVDGGGMLGTTTEAKRTMTVSDDKKISRSIYNNVKSTTGIVTESTKKLIQDRDGGQGAKRDSVDFWHKNRDDEYNWWRDRGVSDIYGSGIEEYLTATPTTAWLYRFTLSGQEKTQGYEDVWFGSTKPTETDHQLTSAEALPNLDGQIWAGIFELGGDSKTMNVLGNGGFYGATNAGWKGRKVTYDEYNYGELGIDSKAYVCFSAHGADPDRWYVTGYDEYSVVQDGQEPQLLGVGTTESDSKYKAGDTFYISLIFGEIVDSQNSTLNNVSVNTSWGTASYAGGADTNILYFKGTVSDSASGALKLNKIVNPGNIKDMCSKAGTATATGTGNAGGSVDNTTPTVTVGSITNTNGTLTAKVTATNHNTLKYTWTKSSAMPATGWLTMTSGSTATNRQTSGTWYLHAMATNTTNGKNDHTYRSVTIPSSGTGAVSLPELTVSANNTNWARSRTINVTKSPSTATVKYKAPGATSATTLGSSTTTVTATQNGVYTFILTNGSDTVMKQVTVSKVDRAIPEATITEPGSSYLNQSEDVTFTIGVNDTGGSGVRTVTGKWSGTGSTADATLTNNADGTYTAKTNQTANASGTWMLTITVTDYAGNTKTVSSKQYTVNKKAPIVTVTKGTTDSNGSVNYTYSVNANGQTLQSIQLPDGSITTNTGGSFKLTSVGTYYVTVTDKAGHVVRSEAMTVTGSVDGEPPEIRLRPDTREWVNASAGVTVTASVYDNITATSASWQKQGGTDKEAMTLSQDADAGIGNQAKEGSFKVTANGTYTVTAKDAKGNTSTETIEIDNIDSTAPTVTAEVDGSDWSTSHNVTIAASDTGDEVSGVKSVKYAVVNSLTDTGSSLKTLSDTSGGTVKVTANGTNYLYCEVEDNAGNKSTCYSGKIKVDTTTPAVSVTGGTTGAESLTLNVSATFGDSGKKSFTVKKGADGTETELTGDTYSVTDKDTYEFTATSVAGKSKTISVHVREILFDSNGGTSADGQLVVDGGKATRPEDPTKTGYEFDGWYSDSTLTTEYDFDAAVSGSKTLYAKWTDETPPVIGTLEYNYAAKNLWNWLIGNKSLTITVPVTDEGSGADKVTYVMTPQGGTAETKTSLVENGKAEVTIPADFKGTVVISGTDKAGNTSASVTVGKDLDGNVAGILIEDNAPQIEFETDDSLKLEIGEYKTAPDITVTVADNKKSMISAGIASISYKIGDGSEKMIDKDYTASMTVSDRFTIPANEIPVGEVVITVTATDHAGNSITETKTIKVHTHSGTLVQGKAATCTTAGNRDYYKCTCGKWFSDSTCTVEITDKADLVQAALGHDFSSDYTTDKEATCTEAGSKAQYCSRCDEKQNVTEIPAKGHTPGEAKEENRTEAACTADGSYDTVVSCTVCGTEISRETQTLGQTGHDFGAWVEVMSPNCIDKGSRKRSCTVCGYTETEDVDPTGHIWESDYTIDKAATCQTAGSRSIHCSQCDVVKDSETLPVSDHIPETDAAKAATCTEAGLTEGSHCSACNTVLKAQTEIAALGHDYSSGYVTDKEATCTEAGSRSQHCSRCDDQRNVREIPAKDHTLVTDAAKAATCTETGLTEGSHCSVCNTVLVEQTEVPMLGHLFPEQWTVEKEASEKEAGRQYKLCQVCGLKKYQMTDPLGTPADPIAGNIEKEVEVLPGAPDTILNNSKAELAQGVLTAEEIEKIDGGANARIWLEITPNVEITEEDKAKVEKAAEDSVGAGAEVTYFDASLFKQTADGEKTIIHEPKTLISITIVIPEEIRNKNEQMVRNYQVIRLHDGKADIIEGTYKEESAEFTFETDRFSTYAICYKDVPKQTGKPTPEPGTTDNPTVPTEAPGTTGNPQTPTPTPGTTGNPQTPTPKPGTTGNPQIPTQTPGTTDNPQIPTQTPGTTGNPNTSTQLPGVTGTPGAAGNSQTPTSAPDDSGQNGNDIEKRKDLSILLATGKQKGNAGVQLSWLKRNGASGYEVYWSYCNGRKNYKKLKTVKGTAKRTCTHKELKENRAYKYYIVAYKMADGKKKYVAKSPIIHVAMKDEKRTNAKKITVNKAKPVLSLTEKKTFRIKATVRKENSKKNLLTHTAELRYYTNDKNVAKVSRGGKITATGTGKCTVYVIANNGVYKKITVTVK